MRRIYKYPLRLIDNQIINGYESFKPLHIAIQDGKICLWAEIETSTLKDITIKIFGTGHKMPDNEILEYIGTVIDWNGFVWHVYICP